MSAKSSESTAPVGIAPAEPPCHVAIIMDGNGRWAKMRGFIRTKGHEKGVTKAKEIAKAASDAGIRYLTLYVFSTENWKRTTQEVGFLMSLIHGHLRQELDFYRENGIRIKLLGDASALPKEIQEDIAQAEKDTELFTGLTISLAINYGARNELISGIRQLLNTKVSAEEINEKAVSHALYLPELPDVDLLIRTGGEKRLSNFLLWQSAYAELIFTDTLWPDYSKEEFYNHLAEFCRRNRRFGGVTA